MTGSFTSCYSDCSEERTYSSYSNQTQCRNSWLETVLGIDHDVGHAGSEVYRPAAQHGSIASDQPLSTATTPSPRRHSMTDFPSQSAATHGRPPPRLPAAYSAKARLSISSLLNGTCRGRGRPPKYLTARAKHEAVRAAKRRYKERTRQRAREAAQHGDKTGEQPASGSPTAQEGESTPSEAPEMMDASVGKHPGPGGPVRGPVLPSVNELLLSDRLLGIPWPDVDATEDASRLAFGPSRPGILC